MTKAAWTIEERVDSLEGRLDNVCNMLEKLSDALSGKKEPEKKQDDGNYWYFYEECDEEDDGFWPWEW